MTAGADVRTLLRSRGAALRMCCFADELGAVVVLLARVEVDWLVLGSAVDSLDVVKGVRLSSSSS